MSTTIVTCSGCAGWWWRSRRSRPREDKITKQDEPSEWGNLHNCTRTSVLLISHIIQAIFCHARLLSPLYCFTSPPARVRMSVTAAVARLSPLVPFRIPASLHQFCHKSARKLPHKLSRKSACLHVCYCSVKGLFGNEVG